MSFYPHSFESGSDSSAVNQGKTESSWWKNTKEAIKRHWKSRAGHKQGKKQPNYTPTTQMDLWREHPFGAFPPIMAQLNPMGYIHERRRSSNPEENRAKEFTKDQREEESGFDLPEYEGQRRPRLDSIFPIHGTPPAVSRTLPVPSSAAVGRSSSSNETDSGLGGRGQEMERRRDEEDEEDDEAEQDSYEVAGTRRESMDSTGSGERSLDRRKRRMGVVRQLPVLPPRRNTGFDRTEVRSLPEVMSGHRRQRLRRPTPAPFEYNYSRPINPPMGPPLHNFAYPHWGSPPADTLPTLSEESDTGDIKGFDDFKMY